MKYLFWDIDGTLLLTGGAGANAMLDVIKEHYFLKDFKFNKSLAGRTDPEIIKEAVKQIKGRCSAADAASLLIRYHMLLPEKSQLKTSWSSPYFLAFVLKTSQNHISESPHISRNGLKSTLSRLHGMNILLFS